MFDFSKISEMRIGEPTRDAWQGYQVNLVYLDFLNCGIALASMNNDSLPILFGITSTLIPTLR